MLSVTSRKHAIFAIFLNGVLHGSAEYNFHQEVEPLLVSLNYVALGSPMLVIWKLHKDLAAYTGIK